MAFSQRVAQLKSSLIRDILAAAQQPDVISFAGGLPDPALLFWHESESPLPKQLAQYGPSEGEPALREYVANYARQQLGIDCQAQQVLILSGSQQGIDLVSKLFIDPQTPIITESPTYLAALQCFEFFGADITGIPLSPTGIDLPRLQQALQQQPAFTYLIPTFQNPAASCYDAEHRQQVVQALQAVRVPLIEDDPYRDLVYDEVERRPLCAQMTADDSWVYLGTFSKTLAPGLRIGFLIASPDLFPHLLRLKQAADLHSSRLGQYLVLQAVSSDSYQSHLHTLQQHYRQKRDVMQRALQAELSDIADWQCPAGGLFFWLTLKERLDTRLLLPDWLKQGLAVMPGEAFYPENQVELGHLRLNFSHASEQAIEIGVARLAAGLRKALDD